MIPILLMLAALAAALPAAAEPPSPELVAALREGGHVIYFRHGATDWSESDDRATIAEDEGLLADCGVQRGLSEAGRRQARAIGEGFRALAVPLGPVLSSPFCRCVETARLAFGRAEPVPDLVYHVVRRLRSEAEGDAVIAELRRRLAIPPPAGLNTVIVAHQGNMARARGISLGEGEAAVFRPGAGPESVARVGPEEWLAAARH